jgi:hypothetical protein
VSRGEIAGKTALNYRRSAAFQKTCTGDRALVLVL